MNILFRYAIKELVNNKGFSVFFSANLAMGLLGFIFLFSVGGSIQEYFNDNLRTIFNADYKVTSRGAPPENMIDIIDQTVPEQTIRTSEINFFSMVSGVKNSHMFNIQAIQDAFPLYGNLEVDHETVNGERMRSALLDSPGVWLSESSQLILGILPGDTVTIGDINFTVAGTVTRPLSMVSGFAGMVQKAYIGYDYAEKTGLIQFGSRVNYLTYFKVPPETDHKIESTALDAKFKATYDEKETTITVQTAENSGERMADITTYITGFLNLINLIALFLSGVGTYYLYRGYARKRHKFNAIVLCLGLTRFQTYGISLIQLGLLSIGAFSIAVSISVASSGVLNAIVSSYLPNFRIDVGGTRVFLMALFIATSSSFIFTFPILFKYKNIKPVALFRFNAEDRSGRSAVYRYLTYLPVLVFFWGIASYFTSIKEGSVFILIFLVALAVIMGLGLLMIYFAGKTNKKTDPIAKIARRNLSRHKEATISAFMAIAAGAFLISTIPQISNGIKQELESPSSNVLPSFFLFDIQPEQRAPLRKFLDDRKLTLLNTSPLVRARLVKINGTPIDNVEVQKNLKGSAEHIMQRGINLSYRNELLASESIIEGEPMATSYPDFDAPADLSLEYRFADNLGVTVGDELSFMVQGLPIHGRVKNLRKIYWNSFQPNFFISFQAGVLEDAPQTFIANINGVTDNDKITLKRTLGKTFPNISLVDVTQVITGILAIADNALAAILFLSLLAIFSGLLVVFLIAVYETREKIPEFAFLKVLGIELRQLRRIVFYELALPGMVSAAVGIILSTGATLFVSAYFFNNARALSISWLVFIFGMICAIVLFVCFGATEKIIRTKPHILLSKSN